MNRKEEIAKICSATFGKIRTLFAEGRYDEVVSASDTLLAMLEKEGLDGTVEYSRAMEWFGEAESRRGNYEMADAGFWFAYKAMEKAQGPDSGELDRIRLKLERVRLIRKELDRARDFNLAPGRELS